MFEKLTRRTFLTGAAVTSLGLTLAACAPKAQPTVAPTAAPKPAEKPAQPVAPTAAPAAKAPVTIRFMCRAGADNIPNMEKIMAGDFASKFPNIKVQVEPAPDGWVEKLLAAMIAGSAVDLFQAWGNIFYNWVDKGLLLDNQPLVDRDMKQAEIDTYNKFQWDGLVMKGVRVGMPKYINLMTISINVDLWNKYGVALPPEDGNYTRADYQGMLQKLADAAKSKGDKNVWPGWCPMWSWDRFWGPIQSFGGKIVDSKYGKTCLMDKPEAMEALKFMYDLEWTSNLHAQPSQVENKWPDATLGAGLIMSCEDGTYPVGRERGWGAEGAKIKWDLRHVPKGPRGGRSVLGTTDAWSITKQTKFPEESWQVLHYVAGPYFQLNQIVKQEGIIPVLKTLIADFITAVREVKPGLKNVRLETIKEILDMGYAEDSPWYCDTTKATEIINPAIQAVYTSGSQKPDYFVEVAKQVNDSQKDCTA